MTFSMTTMKITAAEIAKDIEQMTMTLSIMAFTIITFSIMTFSITINKLGQSA
jgi:hypothetical protein